MDGEPGWGDAGSLHLARGVSRFSGMPECFRGGAGGAACPAALDHSHSSADAANPADTGFCSIYLTIRSFSRRLRTQWSYDSSCQKACPVSPNNSLAWRAVHDFNQRVTTGTGTRGKISRCTGLGITTHASSSYQRLWLSPLRIDSATRPAMHGLHNHRGPKPVLWRARSPATKAWPAEG